MARLVFDNIAGSTEEITLDAQKSTVTVGRAADSDIRSNLKSVSRKHAEFHFLGVDDGCEIVDLNSSNGVFILINGEKQRVRGREYLSDGDEVWCGNYIIRFYEDASHDESALASPFADTGSMPLPPIAPLSAAPPPIAPPPMTPPPRVSPPGYFRPSAGLGMGPGTPLSFSDLPSGKPDYLDDEPEDLRATAAGPKIAAYKPFASESAPAIDPMRISELEKEIKENHIRESIINEELTLLKRENAKLRKMVNEHNDDNENTKLTMRDSLEGPSGSIDFWTQSNHSRVSSLKERVETLQSENEKLYAMLVEERTKRTETNEESEKLNAKLKNMQEDKTSVDDEMARITRERDDLRLKVKNLGKQVLELEHTLKNGGAPSGGGIGGSRGLPADMIDRLRQGEEAAERVRLVVDAIERTDLGPLSTIDRVRLQGAINELHSSASIDILISLIKELQRL